MAKSGERKVITSEFRMSFPALALTTQYQNKGDPYYSTEMIFDPEALENFRVYDEKTGEFEIADFKKLAVAVAKEVWPDLDIKEAAANGSLHWPVAQGTPLADAGKEKGKNREAYRDKVIVRGKASGEYAPTLIYTENKERKKLAREFEADLAKAKALFAGGNYAFAEINLKAHEVSGTKYITSYLNAIKFTRTGERLGGQSVMDLFDGTQGGQEDYDPTTGVDEEIPA